jgi:pilus assembly protein FimV
MLMYKTPTSGQGMGKKMNLITRGVVACALLLGATMVQAAGLGKLTVNSALGQILNAEIDLVSLQPGELDALSARVAPPEAFRDARIEYSGSLRLLRFSVDKRANGSPFIKITSVAPINEPFVDMLIEVSWAAGRIQREYPILLDPPGYSNRAAPPTVAAAPAAPSRPAETPPATAPAASSSAPASSPSAPATDSGSPSARTELASTPPGAPRERAASAAAPSGSDTYGPIEKGDTLGKIAAQVKPQDVSLEQMLVALYRENQAAFINNNMNLLKTGQILKVPSADEVQKIAAKEANTEYRTHVSDWNNYRGQVATGAASLPARSEPTTAASGKVASAAVTPPAPPAAESKDVLKLSKSDAAAGKAGAAKGAGGGQDRVNAMQEELTAKDKALRESQSRVSDLEKQIRDMQRLLDLKAGAPAKADTKTAAAPATPPKAEPPKVEPPKAEPPKVAAATPPPATAKVEPTKPSEPAKTEPPKTEAAKPAEPPKAAEPPKVAEAKPAAPKTEPPKTDAKAPAKKAAPTPPAEKGIVDEIMDNPAWLMGGVGILAALGIGGFLFARRRKAGAEAGPSSSMTSAFPSDLKPGAAPGKPAGGLVDTGNSSFLTDFDKTGPGTIDTDEVDPVAEAEVYIAYGRDAQAEEILKEAMARDKGRHEIPLKLLEIYHARKSATAFETVAKELRSTVGEESPLWQKAAAMGAQIDPNNPLYAAGAGAAAQYQPSSAPAAKPDVDFGIDQPSTSSQGTDFDLDVDPTKTRGPDSTGQQPSMSSGLDFDLAPSAPAPSADEHKEAPSSFDFDLSGLDAGGSKPGASLETTNSPSPMADLSLDLDSGGGGGEGVATKLELAKAYLEIGDKDGAREILQEVAKEGSAAQKDEAEKLIASL